MCTEFTAHGATYDAGQHVFGATCNAGQHICGAPKKGICCMSFAVQSCSIAFSKDTTPVQHLAVQIEEHLWLV